MGTIVAIGGGELRLNETLEIDRQIVKMACKPAPAALFIPTASGEPQAYIDTFNNVYGAVLGCQTDSLLLLTQNTPDTEIQRKISNADIIYVGGGNTRKMMEAWKSRGVDKYLTDAYEKGTILSGLSAGSICWFEQGYSDSDSTSEYCLIEGIGMLPFSHCPHYNERPEFDSHALQNTCSVAIDDNCAVVFQDGMYRITKSDDSRNAYLIKNENGRVTKTLLSNTEFLPVENLQSYT